MASAEPSSRPLSPTGCLQPVWERLAPLPHPVYFVTKDPKWQDIVDNPNFLDYPNQFPLESLYERGVNTSDIWTAQAYIDLKQCGLDVHLVPEIIPGQICFIPYYYLKARDWLHKSFVVALYHDCPRPMMCNQRFVINHSQIQSQRLDHFISHRPQPNMKPRNPSRGATIENLVFKGEAYNLFPPFRTPEFLAQLDAMDIRLVMNTEFTGNVFEGWANYRDADVVMAIRNTTHFDTSLKPALKLINAWTAGVPALLSPEPSYQRLRQSSLDYIEVCTPEDAIAALHHLKQNPDLYLAMIENGLRRSQEFTPAQTAMQWHQLLSGPIAAGYAQWLRQSPLQKKLVRPMQYFGQFLLQKREIKRYLHGINHGPRILTERSPSYQLQLPTLEDAKQLWG
ncbi:glycosyltransferase [Leptolyngbya sp. CCY15150]|uniref:glycosyltransferase n=1 Tax=Leptolyngbya sp. CCY15150 TaxID=2767772 RepID=UPI00194E4242|nr:glycosyltransferase [Leptolyngbya sp. CCY15150]